MTNLDLFAQNNVALPQTIEHVQRDVLLIRNFVPDEKAILEAISYIESQASFRHMQTPSGLTIATALTNCGEVGWVSDQDGYRYVTTDPESGHPWPAIPKHLILLAQKAAALAGYPNFTPDSCLVNRYAVGAKLSLHRDSDELDQRSPIVSFSLGLPATFVFGGSKRQDEKQKIVLTNKDVIVWGRSARLNYHGILTIKPGYHACFGPYRYNLTFRKAR